MLVLFGFGWAHTIYVDQNSANEEQDGSELYPYHEVTAALAHAEGNEAVDTIIIHPGTYCENLSIEEFTHEITLRSTFDPALSNTEVIENTIIKGETNISKPSIHIYFCEAPINIIGLSITNGRGEIRLPVNEENTWTKGGGICAEGDHAAEQFVTVQWCNIYENYAFWGGGIYGEYANFTIEDTRIHDNALYFIGDEFPPDSHNNNFFNGPRGAGLYIAGGISRVYRSKIFNNNSFLPSDHPLYNSLCFGNAAALVWRHNCSVGMIGITIHSCEIYENITETHDAYMDLCQWPYRSSIQFQRAQTYVEPPESGSNYVEISNSTITDNRITWDIESGWSYVNTAVGISRHLDPTYLQDSFINNIVYDNTAGPNLIDQSATRVTQLYGGFYTTLGEWVSQRIPIKHCCVNDAHNAGLYLNEGGGSISEDPLFVDHAANNYNLRWDADAISPCIDSGNPAILDLIDGTPSDIGAKPCLVAHDYQKYIMPNYTGKERIKWICFPVLNEITNGFCMNENFFSPIVDPDILDYVKYKPYQSVAMHSMRFSAGDLLLGNEMVNSIQGYKIKLQDDCLAVVNIPTPGYLIPPDTAVNLHRFEGDPGNPGYGANWVGYFVKESTNPLKALFSVLDHLDRIETAKWTMVKQADGSWIYSDRFVLNYGDLVILHSDRECSFVWETPNPVAPFTLATPTAFTFQEKPSYTPFYIYLPDAKNGELPSEIGLYVNGICKGAVVVEDSLLHICAYLDDGEVLTPDNSFLVFYDPAKSATSNKSIYRMNYKQLSPTKSPGGTYYMINITDPQNCLPVTSLTKMHQNYPNPFNPDTIIRYELPEDGNVQISVYNLKGQLVKQLLNRRESIGTHSVIWDGRDKDGRTCSSGVYYYRINNNGTSITNKMLMLK